LVGLSSGTEIFHSGKQNSGLYFPSTCSVSAQVELANGVCTDIYLLGRQGFFGSATPNRGTYYKATVRKPGFAYRCPSHIFTQEMLRAQGVLLLALRAARITMEEMAKNITCRTFHSASQQVARWMMAYMQDDHVDAIDITHNDLADAIGVRRERVTLVLNQIESHGAISLKRGFIKINDCDSLSKFSCDCDKEPTMSKAWSSGDLVSATDLVATLKKRP
jgi:CRP-like cAMP-binding protein